MTSNVHHLRIRNHEVPPREDRDWVTSAELTIDAGISYRQCDYWTRTGLLVPVGEATPGNGNWRRYAEDQVVRAQALRDLLDAGVSLVTCRDVVDQLVEVGHVDVGHITLIHHPNGGDAA